jgi:hypothetical protein
MPTVLRIGGLRVVIYPDDHFPAHVHVLGEGEAIFLLNCPDGPLELRESIGVKVQALARIAKELSASLPDLCAEWSEIHGLECDGD